MGTRFSACVQTGPAAHTASCKWEKNLVHTGIRSRTVKPVAQSIYRLSYTAHMFIYIYIYIYIYMYPPNNSHITHYVHSTIWLCRRLRLKCDGTRAEKPEFVFGSKCPSTFKSAGGRQFSRLLEAEVCASAVLMLDTACSKVG